MKIDSKSATDGERLLNVLNGILAKKGARTARGYDIRHMLAQAHAARVRMIVHFYDDSGLITKVESGVWNEKVYT